MIHYARIRPGPGFQPGRAAAYYAQRLAILPQVRRGVARILGMSVRLRAGRVTTAREGAAGPKPDAPEERPQATVAPGDEALAALMRDGIVMLQPLVPADVVTRMASYFAGQPVLGPDGRRMALNELPSGCAVAPFAMDTLLACPGLIEAVNDPAILGLVERYLQCKPTISSLGVRWSLPAAQEHHGTQHFHRDTDDWRFVKVFVYLTDVDAGSGPHVFVCSSHCRRAPFRARRYGTDEIVRDYGAERLRTVTGAAGTTFIADTFGIHMGLPPMERPRLILQVQYSVLPVFAFNYTPVNVPLLKAAKLDKYVNRLLIQ